MRIIPVLFALTFLLAAPLSGAHADCAMTEEPAAKTVHVSQTWKAMHVSEGFLNGCLLKTTDEAGQQMTAYTFYDFICALPAAETIELMPSYACCDAGESGDFVCGVKTQNPLSYVAQTDITLAPAKPDRRAIPELAGYALSGKLRNTGAIAKLEEYLSVEEFSEDVRSYLPSLWDAVKKDAVTDPYIKSELAGLLLKSDPLSPDKLDWQLLILKGDLSYELTQEQKDIISQVTALKDTAPRVMPVLVEKLRRTDDPNIAFILQAMGNYGGAVAAYLDEIQNAVNIDIPDTTPASPAPTDPVERARYDAMLKAMEEKAAEQKARALLFAPLLEKLSCAAGQGMECADEPATTRE